jgi:hypothetical protein
MWASLPHIHVPHAFHIPEKCIKAFECVDNSTVYFSARVSICRIREVLKARAFEYPGRRVSRLCVRRSDYIAAAVAN